MNPTPAEIEAMRPRAIDLLKREFQWESENLRLAEHAISVLATALATVAAEERERGANDEALAIGRICEDRSNRCANKPKCTGTACTEAMVIAALARNRARGAR